MSIELLAPIKSNMPDKTREVGWNFEKAHSILHKVCMIYSEIESEYDLLYKMLPNRSEKLFCLAGLKTSVLKGLTTVTLNSARILQGYQQQRHFRGNPVLDLRLHTCNFYKSWRVTWLKMTRISTMGWQFNQIFDQKRMMAFSVKLVLDILHSNPSCQAIVRTTSLSR